MTLTWAWLILFLATYPWLVAADLLSSSLSSWNLVFYISGLVIVAPCRRLRRWQAILFSAFIGFTFEALRPIPHGSLAFCLIFLAIILSSFPELLRDKARLRQGAILVNAISCFIWYLAMSISMREQIPFQFSSFLYNLTLQLLLSATLALLLFNTISVYQNRVMDKLRIP
jgi:cell shape-determining protein MreD